MNRAKSRFLSPREILLGKTVAGPDSFVLERDTRRFLYKLYVIAELHLIHEETLSVYIIVLVLSIRLMGTAAEGDPTRVAVRPVAVVPFDWLSVSVLMHASDTAPR